MNFSCFPIHVIEDDDNKEIPNSFDDSFLSEPPLLYRTVEINVLLPNGFFVQLMADNECTLAELKRFLWSKFLPFMAKFKENSDLPPKKKLSFSTKIFRKLNFRALNFLPASTNSQNARNNNNNLYISMKTLEHSSISKNFIDENGDINFTMLIDADISKIHLLSFFLEDQCDYAFQSLANSFEEIYDDNNFLYELKEPIPYNFRLIEFLNDKNETNINNIIRKIINYPVNALMIYQSEEFRDYRYAMYQCMVDAVKQRNDFSIDQRLLYEYPPEMDESTSINLSSFHLKNFELDDELLTKNLNEEELKNSFNNFSSLAEKFEKSSFKAQMAHRKRHFSAININVNNTTILYSPNVANSQTNTTTQQIIPTQHKELAKSSFSKNKPHGMSKKYRLRKFKPTLQTISEEDEFNGDFKSNKKTEMNSNKKMAMVKISLSEKRKNVEKLIPKKFPINIWVKLELLKKTGDSTMTPNMDPKNENLSNENLELQLLNELEYCNPKKDLKKKSKIKDKKYITMDQFNVMEMSDCNDNTEESISYPKPSKSNKKKKFLKRLFPLPIKKQLPPPVYSSPSNNQSTDSVSLSSAEELEILSNFKSKPKEKQPGNFLIQGCLLKPPKHLIKKLIIFMIPYMEKAAKCDTFKLKPVFVTPYSNKPVKYKKSYGTNLIQKIMLSDIPAIPPFQYVMEQFDLNPDLYLLKICGYDQYLIGDQDLIHYEYIQSCICKSKTPQLNIIRKDTLIKKIPQNVHLKPTFLHFLYQFSSNISVDIISNWIGEFNSKRRHKRNNVQNESSSKNPELCADNNKEEYCHYDKISDAITLVPNSSLPIEPTKHYQKDEVDNEDFYSEFIDDFKVLDEWIYRGLYEHEKLISLWKISSIFRMRVLFASYLNIEDVENIFVKVGIFHGNESLCCVKDTKKVSPSQPKWDEILTFSDLLIQNLPLSARLSITLCVTRKNQVFFIAWINLPLFNYRRCLLSGRMTLTLWQIPKNFNGISSSGIGTYSSLETSPRLEIEFDSFGCPVVYPPHYDIMKYADLNDNQEELIRQQHKKMAEQILKVKNVKKLTSDIYNVDRTFTNDSSDLLLLKLRKFLSKKDPFAEMSEEEKNFFWRERYAIRELIPDALPKVIQSITWTNRREVSQLYALLVIWPRVSVDTAILLLNSHFPDIMVRSFAIRCLDKGLTSGQMLNYLFHLVQLLGEEIYLNNELVQLLLKRALLNRRFGNLFFWFVRLQLSTSEYAARWRVLLEMYCRGLPEHSLHVILKQVLALEEIERINALSHNHYFYHKSYQIKKFDRSKMHLINGLSNPLNISLNLDQFNLEKFLKNGSIKRPLCLEWINLDLYAKNNGREITSLIFQTGNDLRKDMLILQMIRIMDQIWRRENLDLRMLLYNCLATNEQVGLIEVVPHAKTVMKIQCRKAALQIDISHLYEWIKLHNKYNYDNAVDNFTRSFAGYFVATFILGIRNRNPENILITKDAQIFHIDFGHILGHFSKKFDINREHVPLVLTPDFLQVIAKGDEDPLETEEFQFFKHLCNDAYLALHDNASLLISLFTLMLESVIPELKSNGIEYLKETLQIDKSRREASKYFENQLNKAIG